MHHICLAIVQRWSLRHKVWQRAIYDTALIHTNIIHNVEDASAPHHRLWWPADSSR
ncbi:hypothetical protein PILCRDRAFT_820177 [Piloderma croceum F 1598]|uniref:Uncharacterized protein n=1 Tax=Piloderma croceum (strain F 1598) TaxID=765440 RepID=A0A0C3FWN8_PILCF|nr:hypothetical protein PILCRDRAFT_820177 [Piloderma croceum F 1598]